MATAEQVCLEEEGSPGGAGRVAGGQGCPPSIQQAWQVLPPGASARSPSAGARGRWLQGSSLGPKLVIYSQGGKHWFSALYLGRGCGESPPPDPGAAAHPPPSQPCAPPF